MEVPVISAAYYSKLASKLTLMETTLKTICDKVTSYDMNVPSPPNLCPHRSQNPMTVAISNFPSGLNDSAKQAIDQVCGHKAVHSIKPSGAKLLVRIDKIAPKNFCGASPGVLKNSHVKVNEENNHRILNSIPGEL